MSRRAGWKLVIEPLEPRRMLDAAAEPVGDFSLVDVNPSSPTYNQAVSPRDQMGHVSAWYFAHAT